MAIITAREAADRLGLSRRTIYALAASGTLACYRFGGSVRFDTDDLDDYRKSCRSASMPATSAGAITLTAQLQAPGSALAAYFQKAGVVPKRKSSTASKPPAYSHLRLASPRQSA